MRWPTRVRFTLLAAVPWALLACDDDDPADPLVEGTIEVTTLTEGDGAPASYTVQLNDEAPQEIGSPRRSGSRTSSPESYSLLLSGLPDQCAVEGEDPRTVDVTAGQTVVSEFEVTCTVVRGACSWSKTSRPARARSFTTSSAALRRTRYPYRTRASGPDDMLYWYDKIDVEEVARAGAPVRVTVLRLPESGR